MKYFLVAYVAFATIYFASAALDPVPEEEFGDTIDGRIALGNALKVQIKDLVIDVVNYLAEGIIELIPAVQEVEVAIVISGIKALGDEATIVAILSAIFKLFKADGKKIIAVIPKVVANTKIVISNLLDYLASKLPPNAKKAAFGVILSNVGLYLLLVLVEVFKNLLNSLS